MQRRFYMSGGMGMSPAIDAEGNVVPGTGGPAPVTQVAPRPNVPVGTPRQVQRKLATSSPPATAADQGTKLMRPAVMPPSYEHRKRFVVSEGEACPEGYRPRSPGTPMTPEMRNAVARKKIQVGRGRVQPFTLPPGIAKQKTKKVGLFRVSRVNTEAGPKWVVERPASAAGDAVPERNGEAGPASVDGLLGLFGLGSGGWEVVAVADNESAAVTLAEADQSNIETLAPGEQPTPSTDMVQPGSTASGTEPKEEGKILGIKRNTALLVGGGLVAALLLTR